MEDNEPDIGEGFGKSRPHLNKGVRTFLAGLASVIPILGTILLLVFVYNQLLQLGNAITDKFFDFLNFLRGDAGQTSPWSLKFFGADLISFLVPVLLLFLVGFAVTNKPGRRLIQLMNRWMVRVPLLGFIYSVLMQFVDSVRNLGGEKKFKGVAYIEYPSDGCRLIGFITGNFYDQQKAVGITSVFIPTSPNPMTGFVVMVEDDKVHPSDMTLEEASKMILSAGLVAPASFQEDFKK